MLLKRKKEAWAAATSVCPSPLDNVPCPTSDEERRKGTTRRLDAKALKAAIGDRCLELLRDLAPELDEAIRSFDKRDPHVPCPRHGGKDGFKLFKNAETTGGGVCNSCGPRADVIALLEWLKGWSFQQTLVEIYRWLSRTSDDERIVIGGEPEAVISVAAKPAVPTPDALDPVAVEYIEAALERGAIGAPRLSAYYRHRGLMEIDVPESLRFAERERYFEDGKPPVFLPALLAPMQDARGRIVSIQRIYLDPDGTGKAAVSTPKKMSKAIFPGATNGAAIRLRAAGTTLAIAEGIETAESVYAVTGISTWAAGSAHNLESFVIPDDHRGIVQEVLIAADNDANGTGQRAATKLAKRLTGEGVPVRSVTPTEAGSDFNSALAHEGAEAIRKVVAEAPLFNLDSYAPPPPTIRTVEPNQDAKPAEVPRDGITVAAGVAEMNQMHFVTQIKGRVCIASEVPDPQTGYVDITLSSLQDIQLLYANRTVKIKSHDRLVRIPLADAWIGNYNRRQYAGIVFAPGEEVPGYFNLFRGFGIEPLPGDCSMFWEHVRNVLCRGIEDHFDYFKKWLAHMIQHPGELPEVCIVIRGPQGAGKSIIVDQIGRLVGQHYVPLSRMEHITGKFNAHLKDALLIYANEAIWGGDKSAEGILKAQITERFNYIEFKGKEAIKVRNFARLIVTSNERWAVPMGIDDRRFLIVEATSDRIRDTRYFHALAQQMDEGGREALMFDLVNEDLSTFDVRTKPHSPHGFDIMMRGASPVVRYWFERLHCGSTFIHGDVSVVDWDKTPTKKMMHEEFKAFCKDLQLRAVEAPQFGKELMQMLPTGLAGETRPRTADGRRRYSYTIPSLNACREAFQNYCNVGPEIWVDAEVPEDENRVITDFLGRPKRKTRS